MARILNGTYNLINNGHLQRENIVSRIMYKSSQRIKGQYFWRQWLFLTSIHTIMSRIKIMALALELLISRSLDDAYPFQILDICLRWHYSLVFYIILLTSSHSCYSKPNAILKHNEYLLSYVNYIRVNVRCF